MIDPPPSAGHTHPLPSHAVGAPSDSDPCAPKRHTTQAPASGPKKRKAKRKAKRDKKQARQSAARKKTKRARVKPHVGPVQLGLSLQMPLALVGVQHRAPADPAASTDDDAAGVARLSAHDDDQTSLF